MRKAYIDLDKLENLYQEYYSKEELDVIIPLTLIRMILIEEREPEHLEKEMD